MEHHEKWRNKIARKNDKGKQADSKTKTTKRERW
jgi:hypothetical protein